jgi:hypothetical protein
MTEDRKATDVLPEISLTDEEISQILESCNGRALLVGGQALAFWAQYYQIRPLGVLSANITSDADFLATSQVARDLSQTLTPMGWKYWQPSFDDVTPQVAKLSKRIEGQGIKQIDFLGSIVGLKTASIEQRAVTLSLADGIRLRVLHPLDVLESRLKNLASLPSKRNAQGIAQAHLAIDIVKSFLEERLRENSVRQLLDAIERVIRIAQDKTLGTVFAQHGFDLLAAVPADRVPSEEFRSQRWPQVLTLMRQQRDAQLQLQQRREARSKR